MRTVIQSEPLLYQLDSPLMASPQFILTVRPQDADGPEQTILIDLHETWHRDTRVFPLADCSCGQPDARRAYGLVVTPGTCEHLRTVLYALRAQEDRRRAAYALRQNYRDGRINREEFFEEMESRVSAGDNEARWVRDIVKHDEALLAGPLFMETDESDLAKELWK